MSRYLCLGPGCYGIDLLPGKAVTRMKRAYPNMFKAEKPNPDYDLFEVEEDAHVDMHGNIVTNTPPIQLKQVRWVNGERRVKDMKRTPLAKL